MHDWIQIKSMAAEAGMSVNEYINQVLMTEGTRKMLGDVKTRYKRRKTKSREDFFQKILDLAKMPNEPMGASEDDKIIYDI